MASNFPTSLDAFTNPSSADALDSVSVPHATQHSDLNDAVEALEAKVGVNSSAVASSHDYKIAQLEAGVTGGKILQAVSAIKTDTFSASTSNTFTDVTGLSVTITPSSATSKILVLAQVHGSTTSNGMGTAVLLRDSTQIDLGDAASNRVRASCSIDTNGAASEVRQAGLLYLDSPATTSAVVYKIAINSADTGGTVYINRSYDDTDDIYHPRVASTITALEVSA